MSIHKHIYFPAADDIMGKDKPEGITFVNVHVLQEYCPPNMAAIRRLGGLIKKEFPTAKLSKMKIGKVFKSDSCCGATIVTWSGYVENYKRDGWRNHANRTVDYYW